MTSITTISQPMKYGLHIVVIWPGTPLPIFRKVCWMVSMSVLLIYQYSYVIKRLKSNTLINIVDNLSICMPFSLVFVKLCIAWIHPNLFNEILQTMEEECQKYGVLDTNNFISKAARLSYRSTSFVIYMYVIATAFYVLGEFACHETDVTISRELLLKMDLPFDTNESPIYEIIVCLQTMYQASTAYTFAIFNALPLMIVLHVGCQIDIMCQTLIKVPYENKKQLTFFISRHQEIIMFSHKIEKLFTYMALSQLLSNTLLICCLGYIIVIAIQIDNGFALLIKCVLFYIAICLELFIFCFAGEYLNIKSQLICDTAYKFLWYNLHQNETRLLILVILRSQRGFTLTFGKFANLSMESFMAIMKASASYMSVLLAMT